MSPDTKSFYGKDVASAMKEACDTLGVAQENLNIEVVETGSTGIFGLIRKKAHIRVTVQEEGKTGQDQPKPSAKPERERPKKKETVPKKKKSKPAPVIEEEAVAEKDDNHPEIVLENDNGKDSERNDREAVEPSPESLGVIKDELERILDLMGYPSMVTVETIGDTAHCKVSEEHEADLTGQDGRTLDSLQYLLRKIVSRKIPERIRLTVDVGNYRERRHQELREKAIEYAVLVKENGKTQVIPSLNPSERRVVHVTLQEDTEIRSRSVGDGLFKKVLIYKPGKGRKNNSRKRPRGKYRKKGDSGRKKETKS